MKKLLPKKIKYYNLYLNNRKIRVDLAILFKTVFSIFKGGTNGRPGNGR